jgi:hypothetical protein
MVGADELDLVRVVEMVDRKVGTKVHTRLAVDDPKSIYPLHALGYDLAQSMFTPAKPGRGRHHRPSHHRGAELAFSSDGGPALDSDIAIVPAGSASKVVYYSTILTSQSLKVAALLDSDSAGDQAVEQEALWQLLSAKRILRTGDHISGVQRAEIEDLLRQTLAQIARDELGWDSLAMVQQQPARPLMEILVAEHPGASKWKLARAFAKWLSANGTAALDPSEREAWRSPQLPV